jgi:hypothetical protein
VFQVRRRGHFVATGVAVEAAEVGGTQKAPDIA